MANASRRSGLPCRRRALLAGALDGLAGDPGYEAQAASEALVPGFLDACRWQPILRHATNDLVRQWASSPWTPTANAMAKS